ncbi:MAG: adenosine deaminase [Candidatus Krumholzibacteria bacterium]|nr:adenosine deaminase [Candidatus Krumholzibacteria bacterium]
MSRPSQDLLHALPKTDLHVHLDGSLRPSTLLELARSRDLLPDLRDTGAVLAACRAPAECSSLEDYLKIFDITLQVMQDADALERIAWELAEDAHGENVRWLEVRYSPILHQRQGLELDAVVAAVQKGLARAQRCYGIRCGQIICGIRHLDPSGSSDLARLAARWRGRGVVGFDLAGAERDHPARAHLEAFGIVRAANVAVTVHAGEAYGPASIHQALHYAGARRLGHGTRLIEDRELLAWVNDFRIAVEVCLASNVQTRAVKSLSEHPIGRFLREGLRVTLNTDNRLVSGTTVTGEYAMAVDAFDLDLDAVLGLVLNGFKAAFLPLAAKQRLIEQVLAEFEALGARFSGEIARRRRLLI